MKKIILLILLQLKCFVYCQVPDIQWQKCLGGTNSDYANSILQTSDGGYIVAGYASSSNNDVTGDRGKGDFWVVKSNNLGTIEWQKSLGGTNRDTAESIQQTPDGGYIVAGRTESNDEDVSGNQGNSDVWVVIPNTFII